RRRRSRRRYGALQPADEGVLVLPDAADDRPAEDRDHTRRGDLVLPALERRARRGRALPRRVEDAHARRVLPRHRSDHFAQSAARETAEAGGEVEIGVSPRRRNRACLRAGMARWVSHRANVGTPLRASGTPSWTRGFYHPHRRDWLRTE